MDPETRAKLRTALVWRIGAVRSAFAYGHRRGADRAQSNLVGLFIGIMVAGIVGLLVFIPVINDATASSNLSGNEKTIADQLPLFAVLLLLVALAAPLMRRV